MVFGVDAFCEVVEGKAGDVGCEDEEVCVGEDFYDFVGFDFAEDDVCGVA